MRFRKQNKASLAVGLVGTLVLAGCVSTPTLTETPSSTELAPMAKPTITADSVLEFVDEISGKELTWTTTAVENGMATLTDQDGCTWSSEGDFSQPGVKWSGCGTGSWSSGTADSQSTKGGLWPLSVGNKASYSQRFVNALGEKAPNRANRDCKVENTVSVDINGQAIDAFHVVCKQGYGDRLQRSYWYSPEHGLVKSEKGSGKKVDERLIRKL